MADFHHRRWQKGFGGGFHAAKRHILCIHFLVTQHQSSNAIRPSASPKHDGEGILKGWLEKFRIFDLRCHSPNPLCSRIIFQAKSTLIRKNNIIPELSWPCSESSCPLKTKCTVLYRNIQLPFKALKLVFVDIFSHQGALALW